MEGRLELGRRGEAVAEAFLRARRFHIVERNFRCRAGEIDLIARDGEALVFVEVRSRRGDRAGTPLESVTMHKQAQVVRVARHFVSQRGLGDCVSRFDVVSVDFTTEPPAVRHVPGAFDAGG